MGNKDKEKGGVFNLIPIISIITNDENAKTIL